jgi:outer membrane lipoprotein-sorting protein
MKKLMISIIALGIAVFAAAQDVTGLQIMENVYERSTGDDQSAELTMTLINSRGNERVREMKQYLKEYGNMEKKIMYFIAPADVRNTSFMNWSYNEEGKDDDQWIYLPALKKVKRISSDSKSDYFMGSDFTYDDLGDRFPTEDTHTLLRKEQLNGEEYYVVESVPKESDYMYSKTISWVNTKTWIGKKKEFYDEDGDLLKTLTVLEIQKNNGFDIVTHSEMHNVQSEHKTIMKLKDVVINSDISDTMFSERMMKRGL